MSKDVNSGTGSGHSEWRKRSLAPRLHLSALTACLLVLCLHGESALVAQGLSAQTGVEAYAQAIRQSVISQRITAMEQYLNLSPSGSLKVDALEFLIWDHMRLGHQAQSVQRARELAATAPLNPLAIAMLNQEPPPALGKNAMRQRLAMLNSALSELVHLNKPEGMLDRNFHMLRQQTAIMLNGAIGLCYLQMEDYPDARLSLQNAADNDPNNTQWVYGLALALLNGKNRDTYRGYWYLARAANLTEQTPQGQEIAAYARRRYHADGGKDSDWQIFLASAAALNAPPNLNQPGAATASATVAATPGKGIARTADSSRPTAASQTQANPADTNQSSGQTAARDRRSSSKSKSPSGFEATLREPPRTSVPPARASTAPKTLAAPTEAVSLGILIETSLLTNRNRPAILSTLRDIVRNLRSNDEACILVFSDQLDFEQDLTADDQLLEEALAQIRPRASKALLSGISFAAGHLKRIGKNANRILLVISDGDSELARADTLQFRSQVAGVRIDLIGLNAAGDANRATLERIASYSGGKASFASGPEEFRTVALNFTRSMGIAVP
jgi:hypothetical protein